MDDKILERFRSLEERVAKLEDHLRGMSKEKLQLKNDYSGLKGGIRLLIEQGVLNNPMPAIKVKEELDREGYTTYSKESVDKLLRDMVKNRTLGRIKQGKIWAYAVRK